jgi:MSHA biogenesis protein MshK
MTSATIALGLLVAASCASAAAFGQALRDPTEPPPAARLQLAPAGGAATGAAQGLQSIIVSNGRRVALIDGRSYQVGDKVGDMTVASISSEDVLLKGASGAKSLKLHPNIDKIIAGKTPAPSPAKGGQ